MFLSNHTLKSPAFLAMKICNVVLGVITPLNVVGGYQCYI